MKAGIKTTEFFLAIGTIISTLLANFLGADLPPAAIAAIVAVALGGYLTSRPVVKVKGEKNVVDTGLPRAE